MTKSVETTHLLSNINTLLLLYNFSEQVQKILQALWRGASSTVNTVKFFNTKKNSNYELSKLLSHLLSFSVKTNMNKSYLKECSSTDRLKKFDRMRQN